MTENMAGRHKYRNIWIISLAAALTAAGLFGLFFRGSSAAAVGEDALEQFDWPEIRLAPVAEGLSDPVGIAHAGDGSGRLFILEQTGTIRLLKSGVLLQTPFLDITEKISCCGERGLLGLAFPPGYVSKGYFYINYTNQEGDTVVARYSLTGHPDAADPDSETVILSITQPYSNHNGGHLAFGPDGYLYIGTGDGGSSGDPGDRAQDPGELLGKMLRIDTEGEDCVSVPPGDPRNYCVPPANPFVSTPGYQPEIWALGLRNPWRYSFDRDTGDLYTADVGQGRQEEVNFQAAGSPGGENYGWNILEGVLCYNPSTGCVPPDGYSAPAAWYDHGPGKVNGCSITGGYVYRGSIFPGMRGVYFYGDYCSGKIRGLVNEGGWQTGLLYTAPFSITTFGEDEAGSLYVADYTNGVIYQIQSEVDMDLLENSIFLPLVNNGSP